LCNSHTAEVTASSLFAAVAQCLSALRKNEWVEGIEERFGFVKVSVADVRVEHQVKIADFMKWLERRSVPLCPQMFVCNKSTLSLEIKSGGHKTAWAIVYIFRRKRPLSRLE
jgi:hypothetical protein